MIKEINQHYCIHCNRSHWADNIPYLVVFGQLASDAKYICIKSHWFQTGGGISSFYLPYNWIAG